MKSPTKKFKNDVELLAYDNVVVQASLDVWKHFEKALEKLDQQSLLVFKAHLEGHTRTEIAKKFRITEEQVEKWIRQTKREVLQSLRQNCRIQQ